jgi:Zn ribbon nucleic-acid-binding protein
MLEAKCPECGKRAKVSDDMSAVNCDHCGFHAAYDDYIEIMKEKAQNLSEEFQMKWDRRPF